MGAGPSTIRIFLAKINYSVTYIYSCCVGGTTTSTRAWKLANGSHFLRRSFNFEFERQACTSSLETQVAPRKLLEQSDDKGNETMSNNINIDNGESRHGHSITVVSRPIVVLLIESHRFSLLLVHGTEFLRITHVHSRTNTAIFSHKCVQSQPSLSLHINALITTTSPWQPPPV